MAMASISPHTQPLHAFPLSRLGFGGAAIGLTNYMGAYDARSDANRAEAIATVQAAAAQGVNYFDTAPGYGDGLSEELIGEALETVTTPVFVATKVSLNAKDGLRASIEASLRRLRRSSVDLIQLHGSSYSDAQVEQVLKRGGALDELEAMKSEGLFDRIGFTNEDNNGATYDFIGSGRFDAIQMAYNLILQHPYEPTRPFGSLFEAKKRGMLTITMRTATSGIFQRWIQQVNPANSFDYTESLLQFVLSNRLVDVALVGMRTRAMVASSVAVWRHEDGRLDIDQLWNRYESS